MDSNRLIDAQFDRAVEIVQSLPKNGPIQTGYEEKLALYSLYKQATVGIVKQSRPGMWDMLGRAKWDAWAKQKDLNPPQAKWHYVETLQKILRKYPGEVMAHELGQELASFRGDPANLVMSGSINPSAPDDTSSSEESDDDMPAQYMPPYPHQQQQHQQPLPQPRQPIPMPPSDDEGGESADDLPEFPTNLANIVRPGSGVSRYRTPMGMSAGVPATYTPPVGGFTNQPPSSNPQFGQQQYPHTYQPQQQPSIPAAQPLPRYTTPSAFSPPSGDERNLSSVSLSPSIPSSFPPASLSYPAHLSHSQIQPYAYNRGAPTGGLPPPIDMIPSSSGQTSSSGPHLEQAMESMQASLAALRERLEGLESATYGSNPSIALRPSGSSSPPPPGIPLNRAPQLHWDPHAMGFWSIIAVPATHAFAQIRYILVLLLSSPITSSSSSSVRNRRTGSGRSGGLDARTIVRRLVLDASFVFASFVLVRAAWRASGMRRREVLRALRMVWIALIGAGGVGVGRPAQRRVMVDRGV